MSRHRFAIPQTMVPGATRRVDPDTLLPVVNVKNKVPLWDMPTPIRYVEHVKRRLNKKTKTIVVDKVMVPVYRGLSASLARLIRADYRRTQRKAEEARRADVIEATAAHKAEMKMQDFIINPGGHNE